MTTVSYREFTGTAAENYEHHFVPAIGGPVADVSIEVASPRAGERVLAPGGRAVVVTPGAIQPPFEIMERAIVEHIRPCLLYTSPSPRDS